MIYDHRQKAGNEGDIPKHVGLLAALYVLCDSCRGSLCYADAFAGPSGSRLVPGGEWVRGVGKLDTSRLQDPYAKMFVEWYLARPRHAGSLYPGSAMIASDVAAAHSLKFQPRLHDINPNVVTDLNRWWPGSASATPFTDEDTTVSDFLFIDPPGVRSKRQPGYPEWELLRQLAHKGKHVLMWLPIGGGSDGSPSTRSLRQAEVLLKDGFCVTRVQWRRGVRTIGCHLFYRLPAAAVTALRLSVLAIVKACAWSVQLVQHEGIACNQRHVPIPGQPSRLSRTRI